MLHSGFRTLRRRPQHRVAWFFTLILIATTSACLDVLGLGSDLDTSFTVSPSIVSPGDSLTATLVIRNTSSDTVELVGSSCVAGVMVHKGFGNHKSSEPLRMQGADFGCPDNRVLYQIPPHDSLVEVFGMRTVVRSSTGSASYDSPLTPGWYTVRAWMVVDLPDMERQFRVERLAAQ